MAQQRKLGDILQIFKFKDYKIVKKNYFFSYFDKNLCGPNLGESGSHAFGVNQPVFGSTYFSSQAFFNFYQFFYGLPVFFP